MKQMIVFILFAAMLTWFMFAPVYKHILILQQALLQKEVDYLLEIGASGSHGYIDGVMIEASARRLEDFGFAADRLIYSVSTTNGADGTSASAPVLRGTGIRLELSYPYGRLFEIDRLIGVAPPSDQARMTARGMKMSEYVP